MSCLPLQSPTSLGGSREVVFWHANITTWGPKAEGYISGLDKHVVMLCETHLTCELFQDVGRRMGSCGWDSFHQGAVLTGRSDAGTHGGQAILTRKKCHALPLDELMISSAALGGDPCRLRWTACEVRFKGVTVVAVEAYLWTGIGLTGRNLEVLQQLAMLVSLTRHPVVIAADWQATPVELGDTGWMARLGLAPVIPENTDTTCSVGGRLIDFFVVSHELLGAVVSVEAIPEVPWGPHWAVQLKIKAALRSVQCRQLVVPRPLPLDRLDGAVPYDARGWASALVRADGLIASRVSTGRILGVPCCDAPRGVSPAMSEDRAELGARLARLSLAYEMYVCDAAGLPSEEQRMYVGRAQHPRFSMKPVVKRNFACSRYACPKSDFWATVQHMLKAVRGATTDKTRGLAAGVLRKCASRLDGMWSCKHTCDLGLEQMRGALCDPLAVDTGALITCADKWKVFFCARRSSLLRRGFTEWISNNVGKGAARLHGYTNAPNSGSAEVSMSVLVDGQRQCDPDAVMAEKRGQWAKFWAPDDCDLIHRKLSDLAAGGLRADPLGVEEFLLAARKYGKKKSHGADHWGSDELGSMPTEIAGDFVGVLNDAVSSGTWPTQLLVNAMPLLGKPSGGERCVAKAPMIYRIWCRCSRSRVAAWESAVAAPWDCSVAGVDAMWPALVRAATAELAVAAGETAAAALWDLHKFFDLVRTTILIDKAVELEFPLADLVMGLQMHSAPRFLQLKGACSLPVLVNMSVLPGCALAIPFTRAYLKAEMTAVAAASGLAHQTVYVDDVGHHAVGRVHQVVEAIVEAGGAFVRAMGRLHLTISAKSVVVASSDKVAKWIADQLRDSGVSVKRDRSARDLGIVFAPGRRRNTTLQVKRFRAASSRLRRTAILVRRVRSARKLVGTGSLPQALWGHQAIGVSPTVVSGLRTMCAAASGMTQRGRCCTTAIALAFSEYGDPSVKIAAGQVDSWLKLWHRLPGLRAKSRCVWRGLVDNIVHESSVSWNKVSGPVSATIATLAQYGWGCPVPDVWVDPQGCRWLLSDVTAYRGIREAVKQTVISTNWKVASFGWCGRGLEGGIDTQASLAWHKQLIARADSRSVGILECFMSGGYWPSQRAYDAGVVESPRCNRCGEQSCTALHMLWTCPALCSMLDEEVLETQTLVGEASRGADDFQCLWLRGILPRKLVLVHKPFPTLPSLSYVGLHPVGGWSGGRYYTDGSGGHLGAFPVLRRCGFSVAVVECERQLTSFVWGCFSPLPGLRQSVPRSELYAILTVLRNVADGDVEIVTDSKTCADSYSTGKEHCSQSVNADLWCEAWRHVERLGRVIVRWVKAHAGEQHLAAGLLTFHDLCGNYCADALANRAAEVAQVYPEDAANYLSHVDLARRVQMRAVTVLRSLADGWVKTYTKPKTRLPKLNAVACAMRSGHQLALAGNCWHCCKCLQVRRISHSGLKQWLGSPCEPNHDLCAAVVLGRARPSVVPPEAQVWVGGQILHSSHSLAVYRGLFLCRRCGCYATLVPKLLKLACQGVAAPAGRCVLTRISEGRLPPGLANWPADVEVESTDFIEL